MDAGRKPSVSLWAHPALYCIALPLVAVVLAVALAVRDQVVPTHGEPRVLAPWLSLAMGVCLGSLLALPQKRHCGGTAISWRRNVFRAARTASRWK